MRLVSSPNENTMRAAARKKGGTVPSRSLSDLVSVGPATLKDFHLLGIRSIADLARAESRELYERMSMLTGVRQDPCCEDVFAAAIAQARDPWLSPEKRRWPYWSKVRKTREQAKANKNTAAPR